MMLSDEQIEKLIEWFVNSSETKKRYSVPRTQALKENHQWIQPDVIKEMLDEELEKKFLEYYKRGEGRQTLNQIYRDRIIRDKARFKETLLYLLDEKVDITERIDQILKGEGKYHIEGFGKALLTSFLMDYKPEKYCLWNNKTVMGFSVIGWSVYESRDSLGTAYRKVLNALQNLRDLRPEFNLTFDDIDLFLHTISDEEEGNKAVRAVTEGTEIKLVETTREIPTPTETKSMEFAMEKYLEEFIAKNFNKIFGANLELYQDEESSGRQYPTRIGKIDLLAVDGATGEFVVIELKKGKSSDAVVGQILRYMGWVKVNLAKDQGHNVRGIIIVKEIDKELEYALRSIPTVRLFKYNVSFELRESQ